ncbi:MAG: hypothetical protein ACI4B3_04730 [Prevotella sp.]
MKRFLLSILIAAAGIAAWAVGPSGMYQCSVELRGYISRETGKAPNAFLWLPDNDRTVRAVVFAQQNMAEEMLYHNTTFQQRMKELDVALVWVAPAFTNSWNPESCITFLCNTGRGHFDCGPRTAGYIAKFIEKSMERRLCADGSLKKVNPKGGWLAARYSCDIPSTDGDDTFKRAVQPIEIRLK